MAQFYHYTAYENFTSMMEGRNFGKRGLLPVRRFLPLPLADEFNLPEKASDGVITGLLEPMPKSWLMRGHTKDQGLLEKIITNMNTYSGAIALLRVTAEESSDIYVADHSPHLNSVAGILEEYRKTMKQQYWNSLVPFSDYIKNPCYLLPEVLCFSPVPESRIRLARVFDNKTQLINEFRTASNRPLAPALPEIDENIFNRLLGYIPS